MNRGDVINWAIREGANHQGEDREEQGRKESRRKRQDGGEGLGWDHQGSRVAREGRQTER